MTYWFKDYVLFNIHSLKLEIEIWWNPQNWMLRFSKDCDGWRFCVGPLDVSHWK